MCCVYIFMGRIRIRIVVVMQIFIRIVCAVSAQNVYASGVAVAFMHAQ